MTTTRRWVAGAVAAALVLVLASWLLLISPQRSQAADLREQATAQQQKNDSIRLQTQQLKAQFASLPQRQAELAEIRKQMPQTPDLASLVRQLFTVAAEAGVSIESVSPGDRQPLGTATGTAATGATSGGTPGLQAIATTTVVNGTYAELTLFLQKLQGSMSRAYLVENLALTRDPAAAADSTSDTELAMTVTGKVFVLASRTGTTYGAAAASTPATAASTPTPAN